MDPEEARAYGMIDAVFTTRPPGAGPSPSPNGGPS
jgi:hypothetical protein